MYYVSLYTTPYILQWTILPAGGNDDIYNIIEAETHAGTALLLWQKYCDHNDIVVTGKIVITLTTILSQEKQKLPDLARLIGLDIVLSESSREISRFWALPNDSSNVVHDIRTTKDKRSVYIVASEILQDLF